MTENTRYMIIVILILLAVLMMLLTTKPKKNLYWFRWALIAIIIGLIAMLSYDYIISWIAAPGV